LRNVFSENNDDFGLDFAIRYCRGFVLSPLTGATMSYLKRLIVVAITLCLPGLAHADVVSTFTSTSPAQDVTFSLAGTGLQDIRYGVGPLNFSVDPSSTDPRFSGQYSSFCAELTQAVTTGQSATYSVVNPLSLASIGGNTTKLGYIQDLYNKFFDNANTEAGGAAFQLALWEILYDTPGSLSLTSGDFTAKDGDSVALAQNWLNNLSSTPTGPNKYDLLGLASIDSQDQIIGFPSEDPNPIPAPPAVILGLVAAGVVGLRRRLMA
jgi:hypothetical protein